MATQRLTRTAAAVTLATGLLVPTSLIGTFDLAEAATSSQNESSPSATSEATDTTTDTTADSATGESGESDAVADSSDDSTAESDASGSDASGSDASGSSTSASGTSAEPEKGIQDGQRSSIGGERLARTSTVVPKGSPAIPDDVTADAFVLADATSGDVLAARDAHGRFAPGSALTALTGLALLPKLDPADDVTTTAKDTADNGPQAGLETGSTYAVGDLFYGVFLVSANDAASALVASAPGGSKVGIAAVNAEAKRLQANDTRVVNAGGFDVSRQTTSVYDLALVAREGLKNPDFERYVSTEKHTIRGSDGTLELVSRNTQLSTYEGMNGVTTATTPQGVGTYVASATQGGRTLIAAVMTTGSAAPSQATALLDWGFDLPEDTASVGRLVSPETPATTTFVATGAGAAGVSGDAGEADAKAKESSGTGFGTEAGLSLLLILVAGGVVAFGVLRPGRTPGSAPVPSVPSQREDAAQGGEAEARHRPAGQPGADVGPQAR